jgi:hypothetical protein
MISTVVKILVLIAVLFGLYQLVNMLKGNMNKMFDKMEDNPDGGKLQGEDNKLVDSIPDEQDVTPQMADEKDENDKKDD